MIARLPIPPPPTAPAIAEYPITLTKVTVKARTSAGVASTNKTLRIIRGILAPVATAASITPLSTSLNAPSTSLA